MSEDFDREAEKERLREKLEDDQESRKATEHMSDLLLKGATMTNHHCDACGDPIFRYDGQEFCPTCGETVDDDGSATTGSADTETDDGSPNGDDASATIGDAARDTVDDGEPADTEPSSARHETPRSERPPGDDLAEARDSLVRTLSDLAARAEATEDPRRASDLLAAAREAAETLAALDRAAR